MLALRGYYTRSHHNSAVKRLWAGIVLGLVTSREVPVLHPPRLILFTELRDQQALFASSDSFSYAPPPLLRYAALFVWMEFMRNIAKDDLFSWLLLQSLLSVRINSRLFLVCRGLLTLQVMVFHFEFLKS